MKNSETANSYLAWDADAGKIVKVSVTYNNPAQPNSNRDSSLEDYEYLFANQTSKAQDIQHESTQKNSKKIIKKLAKFSLIAAMGTSIGIYAGSVMAHPLDGLRTPAQYAETLSKVGKMLSDSPNNASSSSQKDITQGETNE